MGVPCARGNQTATNGYAHSQLVVHADLKTSNILVDRTGRVRLLDFGIAKLLGSEDHPGTVTPMTHAFASPERRAGGAPSIADDVFALGVILKGLLADTRDGDLLAITDRATAPSIWLLRTFPTSG